MNYIPYAVPFFILALFGEFIYGWFRKNNTYRLADTINSLQMGTLSRLRGVIQIGLVGVTFDALVADWTLLDLNAGNPWTWVFAFVAYDLCYYFSHRYGHEWRILWASHVVHHQSEEYNLSTALRQTSTGWLNAVFYLPLYFIGVPVELMISVGSLNLIYQFWVHTEHVRRIGWLEWIMVSPSNHRVHHAKNPCYIDKNYGGVFIVWDRLFGTYYAERDDEPCRYGITAQLNSWNPIWANLQGWHDTAYQSWHTPRWGDKVRVWFKSPAWNAPDVQVRDYDWQATKFAPNAQPKLRTISFIQFWPTVAAIFLLTGFADQLNQPQILICVAWLAFGFFVQGLMLEGRSITRYLEWLRIATGLALAIWLPLSTFYDQVAIGYFTASAFLSIALIRMNAKTDQSGDRLQSPG